MIHEYQLHEYQEFKVNWENKNCSAVNMWIDTVNVNEVLPKDANFCNTLEGRKFSDSCLHEVKRSSGLECEKHVWELLWWKFMDWLTAFFSLLTGLVTAVPGRQSNSYPSDNVGDNCTEKPGI